MGLFKTLTLRRHAEHIASGFSILRNQQFESVRRSIEKRVEPRYVSGAKTLGGDADVALKAGQLLTFADFSMEHSYVAESDFQEFAGHLNIAVSSADPKQVVAYLLEFAEYKKQLIREVGAGTKTTEEAWGEKIARTSTPIADHIVPESNFLALTIAARLMPVFIINTQMVIADEFRDRSTLNTLRLQMEDVRRDLTTTAL